MKLKYLIIVVFILNVLNIPSLMLKVSSVFISSPISYFNFFILLGFSLFYLKNINSKTFLLLITGILYYLFAMMNEIKEGAFLEFIKFLLLVLGMSFCVKNLSRQTMINILFLGAFTIVLDALFFRFNDVVESDHVNLYNRYSGFYLNPNKASFVCLIGYFWTLFSEVKYKKILLISFTILGFLTLSRTFMLTWVLLNVMYSFINKKKLKYVFLGILTIPFVLKIVTSYIKLESNRLNFIINFFDSDKRSLEVLNRDSRLDTWKQYYDLILESPFIGNGYGAMQGGMYKLNQGAHNTFLLIVGEAGILPFIIFSSLILYFIITSYKNRNFKILTLSLVLLIQLMASHNYFTSATMIFLTVFLIHEISKSNITNLKTI